MSEGVPAPKSDRVLRSQKRATIASETKSVDDKDGKLEEEETVDKLRKRRRHLPTPDQIVNNSSEESRTSKRKSKDNEDDPFEGEELQDDPNRGTMIMTNINSILNADEGMETSATKKVEPSTATIASTDPSMENLRQSLVEVLARLPPTGAADAVSWGHLVLPSNNTSIPMSGSSFTIGRGSKCNVSIRGDLPAALLRITPGSPNPMLECLSTFNTLHVDRKQLKKSQVIPLLHNSEISIVTGSKIYTYLYQSEELTDHKKTTPLRKPSSKDASLFEGATSPIAYMNRKRPSLRSTSKVPSMEEEEIESEDSSKQNASKLLQKIKENFLQEISKNILEPKNNDVSFENFPYFLSDYTKQMLLSSTFVYLQKPEFVKFISDVSFNRRIHLSGINGTERYQEMLVRALAKHFNAVLITIEASDFEKTQDENVKESEDDVDSWPSDRTDLKGKKRDRSHDKRLPHSLSTLTRLLKHSLAKSSEKGILALPLPSSRKGRWEKLDGLDDGFLIETTELRPDDDRYEQVLMEALSELMNQYKDKPCILLIKEADFMINSYERYVAFKEKFFKLNSQAVIIGTTTSAEAKDKLSAAPSSKGGHGMLDFSFMEHLTRTEEKAKEPSKSPYLLKMFPNKIPIHPPADSDSFHSWTQKITEDVELYKVEKNLKTLNRILAKNSVENQNFVSAEFSKMIFEEEALQKIVGLAVSEYLMTGDVKMSESGKLELPPKFLQHGVSVHSKSDTDTPQQKILREVECDNEFEKKLLAEVIPPSELEIKFDDIGALDEVKSTLKELVMLPLQRPELFVKGSLTKPCKGILLFGPPGTGKTMLAKAVASQSGANFINVSMSSIASKWFGEGEKYVKALFTLASKISPTVIFIDEVDSILGRRERPGEHEAMRKIKNEFMSNWDGLKTKEKERVLVLAASNRPFDLDDAVLRRLSRRIMVDLPSQENRMKILKVILKKEDLGVDVDMEAVAKMTEGYSGSDLKNLSIAAAYQPIREFLTKEKAEMERLGLTEPPPFTEKIRALTMKDFEKSSSEISASVSEDSFSIAELRKWNEMYGEGGSRRKDLLPYFL
eukprot:TRINITY_DN5118_c0_g1_i1.p1 TRINITY_DN5118_c0_g1~~TRINITY_DN5118_c0_g1_i1.p1  ORF type:complete len:1073 (+),score=342.31 TRINITY_DN5118_c0_g1_i1:123-3341(+)